MNRTEERLRDALRATANTVGERSPGPFPDQPGARAGWRVPLLAAVSVLVMLVGAVLVVEHMRSGGRDPLAGASMPRFYVTIPGGPRFGMSKLEVRRAETGRVTDGYLASGSEKFLSVAARGDEGRDFFILSQESQDMRYPEEMRSRCQPLHIYRMSLDEDGKISEFSRARGVPSLSAAATERAAFAVTPDGTKIAYGVRRCEAQDRNDYVLFVTQLNENGRASLWYEWTAPAGRAFGSLSWSADGRTLASYTWDASVRGQEPSYHPEGEVRVLTPDPRGQRGAIGGRVVLTESAAMPQLWDGLISPDGRRIIAVLNSAPRMSSDGVTSVVEVSIADGEVLRTVYRAPRQPGGSGPDEVTLKRDASGEHLLMGSGGLIRIEGGRGHHLPGFSSPAGRDFAW